MNEAGELCRQARKTSQFLKKTLTTTTDTASMTSYRALVALAVALLAASTGRVPLLSPPVKAVLSFVLPAALGGGGRAGGFSNDVAAENDDGSSHLRASRLLSIALRNATSDYDEVRGRCCPAQGRSSRLREGSVTDSSSSRREDEKNSNKMATTPLPQTPTHTIQLASIVSEWFRSPEHGAEDEAAFIEFLKFKAKR